MPFVYLPENDCVMVRVTKSASTSILKSGFNAQTEDLEHSLTLPKAWESKFRFAFVRNPFDRLISAWQMFQKHPSSESIGFSAASLSLDKVMDVIEDDSIDIHSGDYWGKLKLHSIPFTNSHYRIQETDFLGRYETLESDWRALSKQLSVTCRPLGRFKYYGRQSHYSSFYNRHLVDRASEIFAEDLKTFGYFFQTGLRRAA